ncbi:MAG: ABC transporter ATP-binding protein [Phycisphaerae bacterium]
MSDNHAIIRLENVEKSFGRQRVLQGVSLDVRRGETTVVIGPSGCGKSVLLKHMVALLRPDRGKVWFEDTEISHLSERKLVPFRRKMGFLFQGAALFDSMTVAENVSFPLEEHDIGDRDERQARCLETLRLVGLEDTAGKYPEELSGGQRKRIGLARAIVMDPEVIFYDEPTTGLDPIRSDLINELILKLQDMLNTTAVVVTHDMVAARKVGDRVVMLHEGNFIADATPEQLCKIDDEVVSRFVRGEIPPEELEKLHPDMRTTDSANRDQRDQE